MDVVWNLRDVLTAVLPVHDLVVESHVGAGGQGQLDTRLFDVGRAVCEMDVLSLLTAKWQATESTSGSFG